MLDTFTIDVGRYAVFASSCAPDHLGCRGGELVVIGIVARVGFRASGTSTA